MLTRFFMPKLFQTIINLIFPISCLGCQQPNVWLCAKCLDSIEVNKQPFCPICNKKKVDWRLCNKCQKRFALAGVLIASSYQNPLLQKIIHCYKYQYVKSLDFYLGQILVKFLDHFPVNPGTIITSLPLHKKRYKLRCFNQAEEVSNYLAVELRFIFDPDLLNRIKNTKPQARLNKKQRANNIKNAFKLKRGCYGRKVIIIDDVFTTGSTLNECAKLLKKAGAKEVWGLVIAKG